MLPHLDTFVAAAEAGSFTSAARSLGVTQAAISQRIQALERELDRPLFHRVGGRIELTEGGRRLHRLARRMLALDAQARNAVNGVRVVPRGELLLAASSVPGEHLLPRLLARFQRRNPQVRVKATVLDSQAVFRLLRRGKVHLGLVGDRADDPSLELRCIAVDQLTLVTPPRHAWRKRRSVTVEELAGEPLLLREPGSGSRACLEQALARAGHRLSDFTLAAELGSNEAIREAVARGLGVAFLSKHALGRGPNALPRLKVVGLDLAREIFVAHDRRRALPPSAHLFLALLAGGERT